LSTLCAFSKGLSGCFMRMGMMAPMVLKKVAFDCAISSQNLLAEKRFESATVHPASIEEVTVTYRALPWKSCSAV